MATDTQQPATPYLPQVHRGDNSMQAVLRNDLLAHQGIASPAERQNNDVLESMQQLQDR